MAPSAIHWLEQSILHGPLLNVSICETWKSSGRERPGCSFFATDHQPNSVLHLHLTVDWTMMVHEVFIWFHLLSSPDKSNYASCLRTVVLHEILYRVSYRLIVHSMSSQPWTLTWECDRLLLCWTSSMRNDGSSLSRLQRLPIIITASRWLTYRWDMTHWENMCTCETRGWTGVRKRWRSVSRQQDGSVFGSLSRSAA